MKEGSNAADFFAECKAVVADGKHWGSEAAFVNLLLATSDYPAFLSLMRAEAEEAAGDEALAKSGGADE